MTEGSLLSLETFLPYRLSIVSNLVSDLIATAYEQLFALRIPEWRMIAVIAETEGITQQALCAQTRMDKVTVSRAAIALIGRGLIERRPHPADKRSHLLHLSMTGHTLYAQVAPKALEIETCIFGAFEQTDRAQLHAILDRIETATCAARAILTKD